MLYLYCDVAYLNQVFQRFLDNSDLSKPGLPLNISWIASYVYSHKNKAWYFIWIGGSENRKRNRQSITYYWHPWIWKAVFDTAKAVTNGPLILPSKVPNLKKSCINHSCFVMYANAIIQELPQLYCQYAWSYHRAFYAEKTETILLLPPTRSRCSIQFHKVQARPWRHCNEYELPWF